MSTLSGPQAPSGGLAPESEPQKRARHGLEAARDLGILGVLLLIFVFLAVTTTKTFLTSGNLLDVVDAQATYGLMAVGGTLVIISGGFDLSAGSMFTLCGVIAALASNATDPLVGIIVGLAAGAMLGLVNGLLCTYGRINAFVGTLATSIIYGGLATVLVSGSIILVNGGSFGNIASTQFLSVNASTYIFIAFALVCAFLLNHTVFGRWMFATGGNREAARLSGISIAHVQIMTYVISGFASALAGIIVTARSLSIEPSTGTSIIFQVLAAILIGGISIVGGRGAIWRPVVGVLILGLIENGFNLNGINPLYQDIVAGAIILGAVMIDAWTRRTVR
jgi:ribose transport system permease protein